MSKRIEIRRESPVIANLLIQSGMPKGTDNNREPDEPIKYVRRSSSRQGQTNSVFVAKQLGGGPVSTLDRGLNRRG